MIRISISAAAFEAIKAALPIGSVAYESEVQLAAPFPHIRSAILNKSQPRTTKPTPQISMTEATAFSPFFFYRTPTTLAPDSK
jgi:hypothetical protein